MGLIRKLVPVSRGAIAWWAWRNRRELGRWLAFGRRALPGLTTGQRADILAEARLRASLTADAATRGIRQLAVRVVQGEAILEGRVSREAHLAAVRIAENTKGIRAVRCRLRDTAGGSHAGSSRVTVDVPPTSGPEKFARRPFLPHASAG